MHAFIFNVLLTFYMQNDKSKIMTLIWSNIIIKKFRIKQK